MLFELLFAYAYDRRTNLGDSTVESGWTIAILCRSLAFFSRDDGELLSALQSVLRRSLCFPLYRKWKLSLRILGDVSEILKAGESSVLATLRRIGKTLEESSQTGREDVMLGVFKEACVDPLIRYCMRSGSASGKRNVAHLIEGLLDFMQAPEATQLLADEGIKLKHLVSGESWHLQDLEEAAMEDLRDGYQGSYV